ncbi:hypothetical protein HJC23_011626 [Cyclotella cryptica]|uniref:chorismate mutase n=1 Tax=Cyclotella cryptica TaxID=29204 RepID=A0ABD3QRP3_9STRA|eukprot:CCRYP_002771-RD/>CCRYP_002771-RD protein AED:0.39 eAED:0.39 QI:337/1/1/1/1/1/3/54/384
MNILSSLVAISAVLSEFKCDAYTQNPARHPMATSPQNTRSSTSNRSTTKDDNITTRDVLSLSSIRSSLIRQEETIIFALIERAQFRRNEVVYEVGGVPGLGWPQGARLVSDGEGGGGELSFLDFMLIGTEVLHSAVRRYESPEEHAFFPHRIPTRTNSLSKLDYPELLSNSDALNSLNWNPILYEKYLNLVVPAIATKGDDEQYGSTVLADIAALQALSKRIHFGKFVAESKYRSDPEGFQRLVDAGDADGVMRLLTNEEVEEQVLTRARLKAATYGREPMLTALPKVKGGDEDSATAIIASAAAMAVVAACEAVQNQKEHDTKLKGKVDPAIIESIYRQLIIPMTKDIEVAYLFLRCGRDPPKDYAPDRMSVDVTALQSRNIS